MVIENYDDFDELFEQVSLEVIDEIDRLWMDYSEGKFGIKGQAKIFHDLGGNQESWPQRGDFERNVDYRQYERKEDQWDRFGEQVGWGRGVGINEIEYNSTSLMLNHLPILMYCNRMMGFRTIEGEDILHWVLGRWESLYELSYSFSSLASRFNFEERGDV